MVRTLMATPRRRDVSAAAAHGNYRNVLMRLVDAPAYWQHGFHDERIRSARQYSTCLAYVQYNAVKHRLVDNILDWPWTSLHFPRLLDPMEIWLD